MNQSKCKHAVGRFKTIPFLWLFSKRVFVCEDCSAVLTKNEYRTIKIPVAMLERGR